MSDHARGCQGREYTCTCGYDDERDALIKTLVGALEAAKEVVNVAEKMTSCRSDDDFVWGAQKKIADALAAAKETPL